MDSQGTVFNAHYLTYFDTSITEYLRNIDYDYHALVSRRGLDFHLVKSTVEYLKPIGYDEIIEIGVTAHKIGKSSLTWLLAILKKGGGVLGEGRDCLGELSGGYEQVTSFA